MSGISHSAEDDDMRIFAGINFGVGISFTHDTGGHDRVDGAILEENGILRVAENRKAVDDSALNAVSNSDRTFRNQIRVFTQSNR